MDGARAIVGLADAVESLRAELMKAVEAGKDQPMQFSIGPIELAGHTGAMFALGLLLADRVDPPELDQARTWWQKAAEAGHTGAMLGLGVLLEDRVDPPELEQARGWYLKAAEAGHTGAMLNLGLLLADRVDPPELEQASG
jgi:Trypsin-co-occurring domain 2/Sel1 repeat